MTRSDRRSEGGDRLSLASFAAFMGFCIVYGLFQIPFSFSGLSSEMMFPFVFGSGWHLWEIPYIVDPAYGTVQYAGSEPRTYGEASLTVNKYRFVPGTA